MIYIIKHFNVLYSYIKILLTKTRKKNTVFILYLLKEIRQIKTQITLHKSACICTKTNNGNSNKCGNHVLEHKISNQGSTDLFRWEVLAAYGSCFHHHRCREGRVSDVGIVYRIKRSVDRNCCLLRSFSVACCADIDSSISRVCWGVALHKASLWLSQPSCFQKRHIDSPPKMSSWRTCRVGPFLYSHPAYANNYHHLLVR